MGDIFRCFLDFINLSAYQAQLQSIFRIRQRLCCMRMLLCEVAEAPEGNLPPGLRLGVHLILFLVFPYSRRLATCGGNHEGLEGFQRLICSLMGLAQEYIAEACWPCCGNCIAASQDLSWAREHVLANSRCSVLKVRKSDLPLSSSVRAELRLSV